jgi:hypothetical protein
LRSPISSRRRGRRPLIWTGRFRLERSNGLVCEQLIMPSIACTHLRSSLLRAEPTVTPRWVSTLRSTSVPTPFLLVQSLQIATRVLGAVVKDTDLDTRAVIFRRPSVIVAAPADFAPRGALELVLHAHDVCLGLGVPFEPPVRVCERLREHTRSWPMWTTAWRPLGSTDDPWNDLLSASGRSRIR